ncbi:sperm acrosome associated 6 isoform X4 [Salvelinus fontinalis]|uniref:sperm acrosome associated 6 isoform X4 n=1 Tax=Salvelinus fontinalis TaxID=8038 RepID=UPI002485A419|nr:sperm acrosome associated 6 isoform X4 [Salvelinus fontinalis]
MWKWGLWVLYASTLVKPSSSCYQCFVEVEDSIRLCWGHVLTEYNIRNVDSCFKKLGNIFNNNQKVIEAGRVGKGYDQKLKEILNAEIMPMAEEFDKKMNDDTVYDERLLTAADNFIAAAFKLPRASGCFPPCGFQASGYVYNCITCQYDSCEFPLDCPTKNTTVMENNRTQMRCDVPFPLPYEMKVVWRFAEEIRTQQVDQFKEVTVGIDRLYSIPSAGLRHQGTYQCEIYSDQRSLVRLYYHLIVIPQVVVGHSELQEIFDLSLLPGGQIVPVPGGWSLALLRLPLPSLLTACLTSLLLLLFLSLGILHWWSIKKEKSGVEQAEDDPHSRCPVREIYLLQ